MKIQPLSKLSRVLTHSLVLSVLFGCHCLMARVLDDFNDNTLTAWQKFDFSSGLGVLDESGGQLNMSLAMAPGRQFFMAATKTSKTFTLQDRRTVEFRVDIVNANQDHAYTLLSWVPTSGSVASLQGYSLAKDMNDVLIAKGLGQYFIDSEGLVKNENVTLVLRLTGSGTSVIINAQVLDKDNNNEVLFDRTFIDTAGQDAVAPSPEAPIASYIGQSGQFVLILFHNDENGSLPPSQISVDNAEYLVTDNLVVDDFNGSQVTGWQKFDFSSGIGQLTQANGNFTIGMAAAPGRQFFVAATKASPVFAINDGEFAELRVDLVNANQPDAYGIVAWIPTSGSVSTLQGYSLAKDVDDILIAKGLEQYFIDSTGTVKNENVTLSLRLTGVGSSVVINAKVLDKDNTNEVLFDKTFTDTAGPDLVGPGSESPVGSYIGQSGQFVLLLFHNDEDGNLPPSQVTFDNAELTVVPFEGNTPPSFSEIQPTNSASFLPRTTQISFKVSDDKPLEANNISVTLNGVLFTTNNGLVITGSGTNLTAKLGGFTNNVNYVANLEAVDSDGATVSSMLYFDTFSTTNFTIESEDYNFGDYNQIGGQFIDNPVLTSEGMWVPDSYRYQTAVMGVDYLDFGNAPNLTDNVYRDQDRADNTRVIPYDQRPNYVAAGGSVNGYYDYMIEDIEAGEWLNYTRTFPAGTYEVYLRESVFNSVQAETILQQVTSNPAESNQTTRVLGSFLGIKSGVDFRNVPLTDGTGLKKVVLRLSGVQTLRIYQNNPEDIIQQNYLIFISVPDPGIQRATVSSVSPAPNSIVNSIEPVISATIENRDTSVKASSIVLRVNNTLVSPEITTNANGASLNYTISPLPPAGNTNTAQLVFADDTDVFQTNEWSFVVDYNMLRATNRIAGTPKDPGFNVRLVQAPAGSNLENSIYRAEDQLAVPSSIPAEMTTNTTTMVVNYTQNALPSQDGYFPDAATFPGIDPGGNTDDMSMEVLGYLQLPAGAYRFGVVSDDGFKCASGVSLTDPQALILGYEADGTYNGTFDFVVEAEGLYPFRFIWYERGGGAHVEWFVVNRATGVRTLINDPEQSTAIKAYRDFTAPTLKLTTASVVNGPYQVDTSAVVDTANRTVTVPRPNGNRFYQLLSDKAEKITSIRIEGDHLVLKY